MKEETKTQKIEIEVVYFSNGTASHKVIVDGVQKNFNVSGIITNYKDVLRSIVSTL